MLPDHCYDPYGSDNITVSLGSNAQEIMSCSETPNEGVRKLCCADSRTFQIRSVGCSNDKRVSHQTDLGPARRIQAVKILVGLHKAQVAKP